MSDNLMAFGVNSASAIVDLSSPKAAMPIETLFNFDALKNIFDIEYLCQFCTYGGLQLEKGVVGLKSWSSEMTKDLQDIQSIFRERGIEILVGAGSLTAAYVIVRKLQKLYQEKQEKSKENEEKLKTEKDVDEQQREADYQRAMKKPTAQDKRELCILCISNHRECVFLDCGHICVCVDCLKSLPFPKTCPICRCKIIQTVLLFKS